MKSATYIRTTILFLTAIVLFGCANESVPQGGKRDEEPPKVVRAYPSNKTLHFKSDKVKITFDEYLKYSTFPQTIVSPELDKKPVIKMSGKTVTIRFKTPPKDSTTYTINFADDIKDLNEGNTYPSFTYVFSTGDYIDSHLVSGSVFLAKDNTPFEGAIVSLYMPDSSQGIQQSKPKYFTKTDKGGNYEIQNVKAGMYKILSLKDQNYNYIYDQPNELIAFIDSLVSLNEPITDNVNLMLFDENRGRVALDNIRSISPGHLRVSYNAPINTFRLMGRLSSDSDIVYFYPSKDTINYWYSMIHTKRDTIVLVVNDTVIDTVRMDLKFIEIDSVSDTKKYSLTIVNQEVNKSDTTQKTAFQSLYKPIKINLSRPILNISGYKQPRLWLDSVEIDTKLHFVLDEKTKQTVVVDFDKAAKSNYTILFPDSMFLDVFGMYSNELAYRFKTDEKENYGNLHVTLQTEHPEKYYIIHLLNASGEIEYEFFFTGNGDRKVHLNNIPAGSYRFVVIDDENKNGRWDTGNFKMKIQPEKIFTYKDSYVLKGGWDLDVEVNF